MLQDILKDFEELCEKQGFGISYEFDSQDYNDSINNLKDFITTTYNTARKELVEEILEELQKEMKGADWWIDYGDEIINLLNKKI